MIRRTTYTAVILTTLALAFAATQLVAQQSNSVMVQTFTYSSNPSGKYVLPPLSERYEKVLMHYKLRCPFDGPCGEWDYLMYIYLFDHTGRFDSVIDTAYSYRVDGQTPDSLPYNDGPNWRYFPRIQTSVTRTARTALDTALVGTDTLGLPVPFNTAEKTTHSQFIWRKAELADAGLKSGNVTGIRFNFATPGGTLRNLTIRMKATTRDTVRPQAYESVGMTTVYSHDTQFSTAGWHDLQFPTPFVWNGTTNVVVDISFANDAGAPEAMRVRSSTATFASGITTSRVEHARHFEGLDYVEVPAGAFSNVDSAITIAFWAYGNPKYQPQDQSILEGVDAAGNRIVNVHLPWSDRTIYWDAGIFAARYDRVQKADTILDFAGKWSYWVFTKNVRTGAMRIYLNGQSFMSATAKKKPLAGIAKFKLGASAAGTIPYDGDIDEFAVFNAEVDAATIRNWMGRDIDASHPFRSNLRVYYKFNDDGFATAADSSGNGFDGHCFGLPGKVTVTGKDMYQGLTALTQRPNVIFEQGTYTSTYDTTVTADSVLNDPLQVIRYHNLSTNPEPLDTLSVSPVGYRYTFDKQGRPIDSVRQFQFGVLHLVKSPYPRRFEVVNRYELGRYITPYGNGLSLGEGFTWTYDVSDFRPLLHDTVDLQAYNQQELVDIQFEFVKGTPPRDPKSVTNLWNGGFGYGLARPIDSALLPLRLKIPSDAATSRIKITPTGHGFGGTENCAEFCPKDHSILVNGTKRFTRSVFRETCALNPVYPQGGTWVYSRTNWCPGAEVWVYDFELTPWVTPGDSVTLGYGIPPYTWNGTGTQPYYQIETQLVTYGPPNFTLDASLEEIKTPSKTDLYRRMNPICAAPLVTIRNTGATPLTSLDIQYGVDGAPASTYHWTGQLNFMESIDVQLGTYSFTGATGRTFRATVANPNGGADQYENNNSKGTPFDVPPAYPSKVIFDLTTNNAGNETAYQIRDLTTGNVVFERGNLVGATTYRDTVTFPDGCYELRLTDLGGDGLNWWANPDAGAGTFRTRRGDNGAAIKTFNPDFGGEIYQQFTVGYNLAGDVPAPGDATASSRMDVFPNPSAGEFIVDVTLRTRADAEISVADLLGKEVFHTTARNLTSGQIPIELPKVAAGSYMVTLRAGAEVLTRRIVVH